VIATASALDAIKSRLTDPIGLVGSLGLVGRVASGGITVRCPWHEEKTPSCHVYRGRDGTVAVKCFGCGKGADGLALIGAVKGLDEFPAIVREAAAITGVTLGVDFPSARRKFDPPVKRIEPKVLVYPRPDPASHAAAVARLLGDEKLLAAFMADRGFTRETVEAAQFGWDDRKGVCIPYFGDGGVLVSLKWKLKTRGKDGAVKAQYVREPKGCERIAYGIWELDGSGEVIIVEGEFDRWILRQMGYRNVLSVPDGIGSTQGTGDATKWCDVLEPYEMVAIGMDADDAGRKGGLTQILDPDRYKTIAWPEGHERADGGACKDPTDFARIGREDLLREVIAAAKRPEHEAVVHAAVIAERLRERMYGKKNLPAIPTGLKNLDDLCAGGLPPAAVTVVIGHTQSGKSTFVGDMVFRALDRGEPVTVASIEMDPEEWLKRYVRRLTGMAKPTQEAGEAALDTAAQLPLLFVDRRGFLKIEDMLSVISFVRRRHGCRFIAIDHLQAIMAASRGQDWQDIDRLVGSIQVAAQTHGVSVALITHTNSPGYDRKGEPLNPKPGLYGARGGAAIPQNCALMLGIWRPVTALPPNGLNLLDAEIGVLKIRDNDGTLGWVKAKLDRARQTYLGTTDRGAAVEPDRRLPPERDDDDRPPPDGF
jgi:archaellum biogenesis ATPase FlaH